MSMNKGKSQAVGIEFKAVLRVDPESGTGFRRAGKDVLGGIICPIIKQEDTIDIL
jgi:hypothetical protein